MNLFKISKLAKTNATQATQEILLFVKENFPEIKATNISINDSKVSLNSVNGFVTTPETEYFFKFHTEENEEQSLENTEYYQGELLRKAGLPVLSPVYKLTKPGQQFLIYEKIEAKTAFDLFETEEYLFFDKGNYDEKKIKQLLEAEVNLLRKVKNVFLKTLKIVDSKTIQDISIYQLFYHRLVGKNNTKPRLNLFYLDHEITLNNQKIPFKDFANFNWIINGVAYQETFNEVITQAQDLLNPLKTKETAVVLGHGDDHNGNKFFINNEFLFFDPAFAGWHPALLSFIKATAHNTWLHPFWLYEPQRVNEVLDFNYQIKNNTIEVNHNWDSFQKSPVREEILNLQIKEVWRPLLTELKKQNVLPDFWKNYIRKALFCCPFLVYNLIDTSKYNATQSLLALTKALELGAQAEKSTSVDLFLEKIDSSL